LRSIFSSVAFFGLFFIENISSHIHRPTELEMRRPNKERYRLDRLLERKAKEGVKIYVIL
jgi:phosphatidylserine/phosphatidylglycerophosphate/cardiolipin synthase-like enzyme